MQNTPSFTGQAVPTQNPSIVESDDLTSEQKQYVETLGKRIQRKADSHLPGGMSAVCTDADTPMGVVINVSITTSMGQPVAQYNVGMESININQDGDNGTDIEEQTDEISTQIIAHAVSGVLERADDTEDRVAK